MKCLQNVFCEAASSSLCPALFKSYGDLYHADASPVSDLVTCPGPAPNWPRSKARWKDRWTAFVGNEKQLLRCSVDRPLKELKD